MSKHFWFCVATDVFSNFRFLEPKWIKGSFLPTKVKMNWMFLKVKFLFNCFKRMCKKDEMGCHNETLELWFSTFLAWRTPKILKWRLQTFKPKTGYITKLLWPPQTPKMLSMDLLRVPRPFVKKLCLRAVVPKLFRCSEHFKYFTAPRSC